ncbi:MAG: hypothetical protein HOV80_02540 [Polyangiaceae bacterium]|nr:hypothetical protein [Polyangiaceae bacterium]
MRRRFMLQGAVAATLVGCDESRAPSAVAASADTPAATGAPSTTAAAFRPDEPVDQGFSGCTA